jgi:hypothetical protein
MNPLRTEQSYNSAHWTVTSTFLSRDDTIANNIYDQLEQSWEYIVIGKNESVFRAKYIFIKVYLLLLS